MKMRFFFWNTCRWHDGGRMEESSSILVYISTGKFVLNLSCSKYSSIIGHTMCTFIFLVDKNSVLLNNCVFPVQFKL